MGQTISQPRQRHTCTPDLSSSTPYESETEYVGEPSFAFHNIPVIEGISPTDERVCIDSLPSAYKGYKYTHNPTLTTHEPVTASTSTTTSSSFSSTSYKPTTSLLREAHQQYSLGRGLFWSLAVLKLCPHFLHPVDLTASEFATLVTVDDADAWLELHRAKLLHRAISRRADAQLRGIELFELMGKPERVAFIAEFQRRQKVMIEELREAAERDIVPAGTSAAAVEEDLRDDEEKEMLELESLERRRNIETGLSSGSSEEHEHEHARTTTTATLRGRWSVFGSLGWRFNKHVHAHHTHDRSVVSESSSAASKTNLQGVRSWKLRRRLSKSHSFRHIIERKSRVFKRSSFGEGMFVE